MEIASCQCDDQNLVAAEHASGLVIELLGGIVFGQQPVGGRIDLQAEVPCLQIDQLGDGQKGEGRREQQNEAGRPRDEVGEFREVRAGW